MLIRTAIGVGKAAAKALGSLLYPPGCEICTCPLKDAGYLCPKCERSASRIQKPFCARCSQPFHGEIEGEFICAACREHNLHFDCAIAPYLSRGVVRELIHRFKYGKEFHLRHHLSRWLCRGFEDERLACLQADLLLPVPLHPVRRRERGFNQAEELARLASQRSGIPLGNPLQRLRPTPSQTRFDRQERMENLRNAFGIRKNARVTGKHLIIIDDVLTTGSTLNECARTLRKAGAASVRALTVARA